MEVYDGGRRRSRGRRTAPGRLSREGRRPCVCHAVRPAPERSAGVAISTLVGLFFAVNSVFSVSLAPPHLAPRSVTVGLAATHVIVDAPESLVTQADDHEQRLRHLPKRAALYGNISTPAGARADRAASRRPRRSAHDPLAADAGRAGAMRDPDFERRASQLVVAQTVQARIPGRPRYPVLNIYAQAPSARRPDRARRRRGRSLRDTCEPRAQEGVAERSRARTARRRAWRRDQRDDPDGDGRPHVPRGVRCVLRRAARARVVRRGWIAAGRESGRPASAARAQVATARLAAGGDWPHTTRVLPWCSPASRRALAGAVQLDPAGRRCRST